MLSKSSVLSFSIAGQERYIDKLKARIDVVREGLVSNPLDVELKTTIIELRQEVTLLIFDEKWINPLPISNWIVVINFILSLNEVSASARKNNRSLNFSTQRSVFMILGYVFNHPQYLKLCDEWESPDKENVFSLIQTMYSEAERQNYTPMLFGDLYAEGEWISNIMGHMTFLRYSPNQKGLISALRLWENFVSYSAKSNPDRILKLFENLKEAATSNRYGHEVMPFMHPETEEFQSWQKMFEGIKPFRISTLNQFEAAFKVLHGEEVDGDWAVFNGVFEKGLQFMAGTLPNIEDIWSECIQGSAFDSIAYMYGVCAFNDLWKQLRECWYLSQPEDADATYCDHRFFSRDPQEFSCWVNDHIIPLDRTIHERHDLKVHIAAACTVLIGDMLNTSKSPSFRFDAIAKAEKLERFITLLQTKSEIINRESVRTAFGWDSIESNSIKLEVDDFLAFELERCKKYIADSLKKCIPNITLNSADRNLNRGDRELVYEAWNQTNQNFWSYFTMVPAIKLSYSTTHLADMNIVQVPFKAYESYYLSEKSGKRIHRLDFSGLNIAARLNSIIIRNLRAVARSQVSKVEAGSTWFISEDDWCGREQFQTRYGYDSHSDITIKVRGKQSFIVDKDSAELVLHEWKFMPWLGEGHPVVINGFTDFSELTTGISSLYYQFRLLNPSGIHLL